MTQESPSLMSATAPAQKPEARLEIGYKIGLVILAGLGLRLAVLDASMRSGQWLLSTNALAYLLGALLGQLAILSILAGIATGVAALMTQMNRSVLFAKCLFVVMLVIIPLMTYAQSQP
jgi:hypothetical protein